jgi:hypothetical protein
VVRIAPVKSSYRQLAFGVSTSNLSGSYFSDEIIDMKQAIGRSLLFCVTVCTFGGFVSSLGARRVSPQVRQKDKPQLVAPETIQGCYELTLSDWLPDLKLGEDTVFITPPRRVQLFAKRGTKGWEAEGYIVEPAPGVSASVHRGSYWLPKGPQSVEIVWTTGFSGLRMGLTLEANEWRGKATTFWDFDRREQTADVVARKVDCQKL